jgi:hypothetical protein
VIDYFFGSLPKTNQPGGEKMLMRAITRSVKKGRLRHVLHLLILAVGIIGLLPANAGAAVIPADQADPAAVRAANIDKLKTVLEREEVAARLADYGLTPDEVSARLDRLSDRQVAELAAQADQINAGGDAVGYLISIALLVLLVLLILHLLGYIDLRLPRPKPKPAT